MLGIQRKDFYFILKAFLVWRVSLLIIQHFAIHFVPLQETFLGGEIQEYIKNPHFWSHVNFDGKHYLSIIQFGYRPLQFFFFPVYPMIVGLIGKLFNSSLLVHALIGQVISNLSLLVALIGIFRLVAKGENGKRNKNNSKERNIARRTIILLLIFPTSYYFASFYTESLYLLLCVWSFYFAKKKKWITAFILAGVLTATRLVGLALVAGLVVEVITQSDIMRRNYKFLRLAGLTLLGLSGLIIYLYYLAIETGDPLYFINNIGIYGEQRSSEIILFPQVLYRYIFKILPNIDYSYYPIVFSTWLEFLLTIAFGLIITFVILGKLGYERLRKFEMDLSYLAFSFVAYIIPTMSGSFSSMPRYVLIIFPAFILVSKISINIPLRKNLIIYSLLAFIFTYFKRIFAFLIVLSII
jgi:hypothetical protein